MSINKTEKQELLEKLNLLLRKQLLFQQEINELQRKIVTLKVEDLEEKTSPTEVGQNVKPVEEAPIKEKVIQKIPERPKVIQQKKVELAPKLKNLLEKTSSTKLGLPL